MFNFFKKAYSILEFNKILKKLNEYVSCEETKNLINNIVPSLNLDEVKKMCNETDEALVVSLRFNKPEFLNFSNPKSSLKSAKLGITMNSAAIFNVGIILKEASILKKFHKKNFEHINHLKKYFENLFENKELENLIFKCLISKDEVSDDASIELKKIRSKIKSQKNKIKNALDEFLKGEFKKYLQESTATIRHTRHVLAVKAEHIKQIPGLVQDVSSSGSTVFVEPSSVVAIENELKKLYNEEKIEIAKILKKLTQEISKFALELNRNYDETLNLDLIFAKANLANFMDAVKPNLVNNGEISLKKARHPLINRDIVVPVDIEFGGKFKNLIISGPNTGGKTVVLKTVGLLTYMAMCGFLIPASEESKVSVFNNILIAIGDEQSIENSLSTFSAHMKNVVEILNVVNEKSLVLIDELASGTDPEQGAALAVAIVEKICFKKATLLATTHYSELKTFAFKNDYVKNASFEFDLKNLKPTYKLLMGLAGQSNAFEISKKIGIEEKILNRAKSFMLKKSLYLNNMLDELKNYKKEYEKRFNIQKQKFLKLKLLKEEILKEKKYAEKKIKDAQQKANLIVDETRISANNILNELKEIKSKINKKNVSEIITKTKSLLKKSVYGLYDEVNSEKLEDVEEEVETKKLKVGDFVLIKDLEKKAEVLEEEDKNGKILVLVGNIKTRIETKRLKFLEEKLKQKQIVNVGKKLKGKKNRNISTEVDLRGLNSQEAILTLDKFIDEAVLNNLGIIRIIHGKGSGILKKAVTKHLNFHPNILSKRLGVYGEGEDGVTIVELKQ